MGRTYRQILIVTGEASGEMRAAPLVQAIGTYAPDIHFIGIGGDRLREAGVQTFADIDELSVMGFSEVLRHFPRIKKIFDLTVQKLKEEKPDAVLLVDYPGFNLRLAREAKKLGIKVIYYVSPQVWAWKASRVKLIKKVVDRMIVLFPFEKDFYAKHAYAVDFVGHPIIDEVCANKNASAFLENLGLDSKRPTLALLPGSRKTEVLNHLPALIGAAEILKKDHPELQVILLQAKNLDEKIFLSALQDAPDWLKVSQDYYNALHAADLCVVASGTATLETGVMEKPMVVIYKTSWITSLIVRLVIRIPYISLVNIVAGKKIVEELLQQDVSPQRIALEIDIFLRQPEKAQHLRMELSALKEKLGAPGASQRAAKVVIAALEQK